MPALQSVQNPEFVARMREIERLDRVMEICKRAAAQAVEEVLAQPDFGVIAEHPENFKHRLTFELKVVMLRTLANRMGLVFP